MFAAKPREAAAKRMTSETKDDKQQSRVLRRRPRWRSPLTRRILAVNALVLVIPVLGLLHLEEYRNRLIEAELQSLETQARAFAFALSGGAVVVSANGEERLVPQQAARIIDLLLADTALRARLFLRNGEMLIDSFRFAEQSRGIEVEELPPPGEGQGLLAQLERLYENLYENLLGSIGEPDDLPVYVERERQMAVDYEEAEAALSGKAGGQARIDKSGGLVLSVAVPVQRYRQVLASLMLSKDGREVETAVSQRRGDILLVFGVAFAVTVLLSFYLAGTIGRPIRRLAEAADKVRGSKSRQAEIPDFGRRRDEIGDLSAALREMTEALWSRLDAIERFAADVAHEIKNPLTSLRSAVETVSRIDDPQHQKKLMAIILEDVERLDRLISDISDASRLDAELSRAQMEEVDLTRLVKALVETYSTPADGKPVPRLVLDGESEKPLVVPGIEDRIGQVLRNLITNAMSFAPPDSDIRLSLARQGKRAVIAVEDEGPGLPEGKLDAIFDRFYSERPKEEKFGTHSGLGLSISKQIVEAHGGEIRAENRRDEDGNITGARFIVSLPLR